MTFLFREWRSLFLLAFYRVCGSSNLFQSGTCFSESNERGVVVISFLQENRLYLLLGLAAECTFVWLLHFRGRLQMAWYVAIGLSLLHVAYGVFCVKAFAVLEGNELGEGAMSLFGAVFFMPLAYWLGAKLTKRSTAEVFDIFAICMIFTLMCARVNCLFAGCCIGRQISSHSALRWPTRELELVFYAVFLFLMTPRVWRGKTYGQVYPVYMITYGLVRSVLECFRVSSTNNLFHLSHVWALASIAIGAAFYAELKRSRERKKSRKHS